MAALPTAWTLPERRHHVERLHHQQRVCDDRQCRDAPEVLMYGSVRSWSESFLHAASLVAQGHRGRTRLSSLMRQAPLQMLIDVLSIWFDHADTPQAPLPMEF